MGSCGRQQVGGAPGAPALGRPPLRLPHSPPSRRPSGTQHGKEAALCGHRGQGGHFTSGAPSPPPPPLLRCESSQGQTCTHVGGCVPSSNTSLTETSGGLEGTTEGQRPRVAVAHAVHWSLCLSFPAPFPVPSQTREPLKPCGWVGRLGGER